jgi:SAM-dependent methyltransferase
MKKKELSIRDLIVETHVGLERQGPGSPEMTIKALSFLDNPNEIFRVADLGCGTGGQTMILAQYLNGVITGIDQFPDFINAFNKETTNRNLQNRVQGVIGSMGNLSFQKDELDLIWSEGAIDNIGFEKGLTYWNGFIRKDGYIAVTNPSWFTDQHPEEVEKFWTDAGSRLDSIEYNISIMQQSGYRFVAAFALHEKCWTENYFIPREAVSQTLLKKYADNKMVKDFIKNNKYEIELYLKYKQHYGYVFYIGQKI